MFTQNDSMADADSLVSILSGFEQITLDEMDSVKLMSRTDTKFVFNIHLLPLILQQLQASYKVLNVEGSNINAYQTLYYDTDDFLFYHHHHNGKGNRSKVRYRTYIQSNTHFFEVKNKSNKNITIKKRIKSIENKTEISTTALNFYHKHAFVNDVDLKPKLWVNYSRITLVNKMQEERLTIDINLTFKNETNSKEMSNFVIAELKQGRKMRSSFLDVIKANAIKELSISKYCLGIIELYKNVKKNNFKPKLVTLKKISHEIS